MKAETTSPVGTRIARVRVRLSHASCHREAFGGATLREDSAALSDPVADAAP